MRIKKIGHCCLTIEVNGKKIMTDPGCYSLVGQEQEQNVDIILITHEHGDHLHVESLREVLKQNTNAHIITNTAVSEILKKNEIACTILDSERESHNSFGVHIESFPGKHEEIFEEIGQVQNTGYMINGEFFYPGDAFTNPEKPVRVLALPIAGPWMALRQAILYAQKVKPEVCFNVHDGYFSDIPGSMISAPKKVLAEDSIEYVYLNQGEQRVF